MSSVTTTKIDTKDGATNLTITTGNTIGPKLVVNSSDGVWIGNSTANVFVANTQKAVISTTLEVSGDIVLNGALLNTSGSLTINDSVTVNGAVTGVSTITANTLNAVNGAISTNTFSLGTSSVSSTGYSRLPNGLLYQWGTASATSSSTGNLTFPVAFSTVYSLVATANQTATYAAGVIALSTTGATIRTANTTSATVYWMAIGV